MEVYTVGVLRFADLNSCLEGGFVYSSKRVEHACANVNPSISIILEILHMLVDLLVAGNIGLEAVGLLFSLVLEGAKFLLKLSSTTLGKTPTKKIC